MATEPFLINPPKKRKSKSKPKLFKKITRKKKHRPVVYAVSKDVWERSAKNKSKSAGIKINPGEVVIVGSNPVKRKKSKRKIKRNAWSDQIKRHSKAAKKGWRRRSSSVSKRRRVRRNPAAGAISLKNPASLIMPVAVGLTSHLATKRLPDMIGVTGLLPKLGVQAGIAFGVPLIGKKMLGSQNAKLWTIVSVITVLSDVVEGLIIKSTVSGLGEIEGTYPDAVGYEGVGAFPEEIAESSESLGAFPYDEEVQY